MSSNIPDKANKAGETIEKITRPVRGVAATVIAVGTAIKVISGSIKK